VLLTPRRFRHLPMPPPHLIPLKDTIATFAYCPPYNIAAHYIAALENLLGNPLLFLPFGIFGAIFFNSNKKMILIAAFFFSLGIETSQLVFSLGEFDVDDIILNVLGACFGILLWNKYKNKIIRYE
jgi:glycopeptide antibiotics resistance protein